MQEIAADMLHLDGASIVHGQYQSCYRVTINKKVACNYLSVQP